MLYNIIESPQSNFIILFFLNNDDIKRKFQNDRYPLFITKQGIHYSIFPYFRMYKRYILQ